MYILLQVMAPLFIIHFAMKDYPEFSGLKGKIFPGQEKPERLFLVDDHHMKIIGKIPRTMTSFSSFCKTLRRNNVGQVHQVPSYQTKTKKNLCTADVEIY
jgi:hypothetical protein